jgi:hypothetical protein
MDVALSNAEKQAAWRRRRDAKIASLQAEVDALRNQCKPEAQPVDDRELQQLRAEIAELRAKLAAQAGVRRSGDELSATRKLIEEIRARPYLDDESVRRLAESSLLGDQRWVLDKRKERKALIEKLTKAALAAITRVQTNYVTGLRRIDAKIAELAEVVPDVKLDDKRRKIQARIDRGSTEGERAAARHLLAKLPNHEPERVAPAPEPLPRSCEEMLARKGRKRRE